MPSPNTWLNFTLVALVVSLVPGPAFIIVLTTALRRGFRPGAYATAGIVIGDGVYFFLTAIGLGSLLATSFWTFTIIKWLGIAYLVYLGLRSLFFPSNSLIAADENSVSGRSSFAAAFTVQLANPKLLLFLAALVPQFLDPTHPIAPQLAVLGGTFMVSDTIIYLLLSMLAARARPLFASPRATRIVSRVSGVAMLGAAARVATR
jgi:homoserine/homoserine lactone efflux protein